MESIIKRLPWRVPSAAVLVLAVSGCGTGNGGALDADGFGDPDMLTDAPLDADGGDRDAPSDLAAEEGTDMPSDGDEPEEPTCATASDEVVPAPIDIIIGIDQSASMGEEIQGVKDNLNTNLVSILTAAGIDFHVIFMTGVPDLPTGPRYHQCEASVNSSDMLTLFLWTYEGDYKAPNTCDRQTGAVDAWRDWLRFDSLKVFIAVTDDDPSSFNCAYASSTCTEDCGGCINDCEGWCPMFQCPTYADRPAEWDGEDFPTELYGLEPAGMFGTAGDPRWIFHSIVPVTSMLTPDQPLTPLDEVCNDSGNTGETSGVEYQKLSRLTGGLRFPSCDTDYSPVFAAIAETIVPMACTFFLAHTDLGTPDPTRTTVEIDYADGLGPQIIPQDNTAPCDGGANGWQWEVEGEIIRLCGTACESLKSTPDATVTITVGCATVVFV
jgi:hypothetical protein